MLIQSHLVIKFESTMKRIINTKFWIFEESPHLGIANIFLKLKWTTIKVDILNTYFKTIKH